MAARLSSVLRDTGLKAFFTGDQSGAREKDRLHARDWTWADVTTAACSGP